MVAQCIDHIVIRSQQLSNYKYKQRQRNMLREICNTDALNWDVPIVFSMRVRGDVLQISRINQAG